MKILNKFIWSKKEPSNKNDIWFDGSTWRMYTEEAWQSFTLPVDAADKVAKVLENASEVYQEKLNAGYGIIIEGNTISVDDSNVWEAIETLQQNKVEQIQLNDYVPLDRYVSTSQVLMDNISELASIKLDKANVATINGQSLIKGGNIVIEESSKIILDFEKLGEPIEFDEEGMEMRYSKEQFENAVGMSMSEFIEKIKTSELVFLVVGGSLTSYHTIADEYTWAGYYKMVGLCTYVLVVDTTPSEENFFVGVHDEAADLPFATTEYVDEKHAQTETKLTELSERIDDIADLEKISEVGIHLSDIYGFVGDTIQVFFNSIIENYENYVIKIGCKYGKIYPKYYECTPSVECNEPLTISVYTNNGVLLASKEVRLVATSAKNATSAKRVLIIGDSTIQNGEVAIEMSRRLKGTSGVASSPSPMALSNYTITGRIKNTDGSVGWEGIGGWRWDEYLGSAGNPGARLYVDGVTDINVGDRFKLEGFTQEFLISEKNITNGVGYVYATFYGQGDIYKNHSLMPTDGTMTRVVGSGVASFAFSNARVESYQPLWNTDTNQWDILGYCNEHCGGAVHCICTQLGINSLGRDAFGSYADIADKVRLFLDRTHSQMPNCIVLLGKIMLPSQMGGLGKDYTTNDQFGNYNAEGFNVKIHQYNAILESIANEEKYSSFVKVVDLCSQFDAVNNYPTFEKQVNTRNPQKEALGGNGVHPNNYGYWQVADAWIRAIVNVMIQKHTPVEVTYQVTTPDGKLFSDYVKSNFKVAGDLSAQIEIVDIDAKQYNGLNYIAVKKGDIMVATKDAAATSYQVGFATSLENGTPITPASAYPTPSGDSTFTCPSDGYYLWYGGASNPFNFVQKIMRTTME